MKRRTLLVIVLSGLLIAAGNDAGNQMMTYADLSAYVAEQLFYLKSGQTVTSSSQMVTAGQYAALILNSGTPGYASNELIAYNDALTDAATPSPSPTPVPTATPTPSPTPAPGQTATATPIATATPTVTPTTRPTARPTLKPTSNPSIEPRPE